MHGDAVRRQVCVYGHAAVFVQDANQVAAPNVVTIVAVS